MKRYIRGLMGIIIVINLFMIIGCETENQIFKKEHSEDKLHEENELLQVYGGPENVTILENEIKCVYNIHGDEYDVNEVLFIYDDDFQILRVINSNYRGDPLQAINSFTTELTKIESSEFIDYWSHAPVFGDYNRYAYDIKFKFPVLIEFNYDDELYQYTLSINKSKKTENRNKYVLRTESVSEEILVDFVDQLASILLNLGLENIPVYRDEYGYFLPISTFDTKSKSEDFIEEIEQEILNGRYQVDKILGLKFVIKQKKDYW